MGGRATKAVNVADTPVDKDDTAQGQSTLRNAVSTTNMAASFKKQSGSYLDQVLAERASKKRRKKQTAD